MVDCLCGAAWCSVSCSGLFSCQKHFLLCRDKLILLRKHTRSALLSITTTTTKRFSPTCLIRCFYLFSPPWKYKVQYTLKHTQNTERVTDTHRQVVCLHFVLMTVYSFNMESSHTTHTHCIVTYC